MGRRIAVTGARGQLGQALQAVLTDIVPLARAEYDITDPRVADKIAVLQPEVVIHAAALTNVDACERDVPLAYRLNALGTQHVAQACRACGAAMVYMSTDYVFDGTKGAPYVESDKPNPLSVYGRSKLAGEYHVQAYLRKFYIVRTAWLYSRTGNSFVTRILNLAEERPYLQVVTTEFGSPTYASDLAEAIARLIEQPAYGIYHLVNEGACSRYEFARAILDLAGKSDYVLEPVDEFPRAARPPKYGVLQNTRAAELGIVLRPWQAALAACFEE